MALTARALRGLGPIDLKSVARDPMLRWMLALPVLLVFQGCDLDPQALLATQNNAETNGLGSRIDTCLPDAMPAPTGSFDLVMANILAGPLQQLAPVLAGHCRDGGQLVLSGILAQQAESVMAAYRGTFDLDPVTQRGDWVRLSGRRRPRSS